MMSEQVVASYVKYNFLRVMEVLLIIASVFFTMQFNIRSQGEMLESLNAKNEQVTTILHGLVVTVAKIQTEQAYMKDDIKSLEGRH